MLLSSRLPPAPPAARVCRRRLATKTQPPPPAGGAWQAVVGLEIHAQIAAAAKMFSAAPVAFAAAPNSLVAFWDAALPGCLPVLNARCVEAGVATALALGARVNRVSAFDRKHYFYGDLPAGYQITQQRVPLAEGGAVDVGFGADARQVRIARLHLEHDSGKSLHTAPAATLVDLNRAGVGLMEIVTQPDLRGGEEAAAFVHALLLLLRALGTCHGRLEEGSLRVDANVSVRPRAGAALGVRCEIKNINGLRFLAKAVDHEIARHVAVLEGGGQLVSETRTYDAESNTTLSMRAKEGEVDYRYMPEPDLPPLRLSDEYIARLHAALPELPRQAALRLVTQGLTLDDSRTLVDEPGGVAFMDECLALLPGEGALLSGWIVSDLFAALREQGLTLATCRAAPPRRCWR